MSSVWVAILIACIALIVVVGSMLSESNTERRINAKRKKLDKTCSTVCSFINDIVTPSDRDKNK